jgi:hypothetical protein
LFCCKLEQAQNVMVAVIETRKWRHAAGASKSNGLDRAVPAVIWSMLTVWPFIEKEAAAKQEG